MFTSLKYVKGKHLRSHFNFFLTLAPPFIGHAYIYTQVYINKKIKKKLYIVSL